MNHQIVGSSRLDLVKFPTRILMQLSKVAMALGLNSGHAWASSLEWYPPEVETGAGSATARVIISGRATKSTVVTIDGRGITVIRPAQSSKGATAKVSTLPPQLAISPQVVANAEGYFEVAMELPLGLLQVPIVVAPPGVKAKTYLITFDVRLDKVRMNTAVTTQKPPAAAKSLRVWLGFGTTYQTYKKTDGDGDLNYKNLHSPSLLFRFGYWINNWGVDAFYRSAPGKIDAAESPFTIGSTEYRWDTLELRGLYQFARESTSRMLGFPSQWQLFFGVQDHKLPFLDIESNRVSIRRNGLTMVTLGIGLMLGQERDWTYEASVDLQMPVASSAEAGTFKVSAPFAIDARFGTAYKFAPNWRAGAFMYLQSHKYQFSYINALGAPKSGEQDLFYSTLDFHLGYEY